MTCKRAWQFDGSIRVPASTLSILFFFYGDVAQLARALAWHARGRGFESHLLHKTHKNPQFGGFLFYSCKISWVRPGRRSAPIFSTQKPAICGLFLYPTPPPLAHSSASVITNLVMQQVVGFLSYSYL
jgi:hypothetical protein